MPVDLGQRVEVSLDAARGNGPAEVPVRMEVGVDREAAERRERLHQLFELARSYRNLTMSDLAKQMGRSPSNILRQGDNPKLDLVIGLANCLEWTPNEVANFIWSGKSTRNTKVQEDRSSASGNLAELPFDRLQDLARQAREEGRLTTLGRLVEQMQQSAATVKERALGLLHHAFLAAATGDPCDQERVGRELIQSVRLPDDVRLMGLAQIAQANLSLGRLADANDNAKAVIRRTHDLDQTTIDEDLCSRQSARAAAQEVRGHVACRQLSQSTGRWNVNMAACRRDAYQAIQWLNHATKEDHPTKEAAALIRCKAALAELDVALGSLPPNEALDRLHSELDQDFSDNRDLMESKGWTCVYGADISLRFLPDSSEKHRSLAVFSERGFDIADKIDSWHLRERLLTLDYEGSLLFETKTQQNLARVIDSEDVRVITATMRRFPNFRDIGLDILTNSQLTV